MKKIIFTITVFLTSIVLSFAQQVISAAGETSSVSGYEVSWTAGEPVIQTWSSGNTTLTQGFHQSLLTVTPAKVVANNVEIKVYPNPTSRFVTIRFSKLADNNNYALFNPAGEKLAEGEIRNTQTRLNLQNQASGSYLLKLMTGNKDPIQTFKIVKK